MRALARNTLKKDEMADLIKMAEVLGPLGAIMLMLVVRRDSGYPTLTRQHFDDESTVTALNIILQLLGLSTIDSTMLFSTIGTVFGNAGQSP